MSSRKLGINPAEGQKQNKQKDQVTDRIRAPKSIQQLLYGVKSFPTSHLLVSETTECCWISMGRHGGCVSSTGTSQQDDPLVWTLAKLCQVCFFSTFLHGFPPGASVSSHSPKICTFRSIGGSKSPLGVKVRVNGVLYTLETGSSRPS